MGSISAEAKLPWIETPLISSPELSRAAGCNILLKLENLQPSGSFKSRGVGNLVLRAVAASASADVHFYCSSGGNAGLACATSAAALGLAATIVTPTTTPQVMIARLRLLGAHVSQVGASWIEADRHLRANLLARDPHGVYVPPFDHPDIWAGAATLVSELARQTPPHVDIDAVVASVGGGGLVNGLLQGLEDVERDGAASAPWPRGRPPTVVAVETRGADSLHASVEAGRLVTLPAITSIATSLGAVRVSERTWEWARRKAVLGPRRQAEHGGRKMGPAGLESLVVSDAEAAMACVRFAHDARFVVEVACGATVAVCYNGALRERLGRGLSDDEWRGKNVVVVVCGGSNVSLEVLEEYKATYAHMV
ncbi:hypothetical protein BN1708_002375 [Verticillium longisporum]|uniref:L-serine ammonia-lyase n=1 Tax=Verticillium longisporum TaxID=100787 RepID=A0A0G4KQD4_VERLO|nr:hypothetical protein BN1708_002375 [Verticillium longisporum]